MEETEPWIHIIFKITVNASGDLEGQELHIADRAETLAWSTWRWGRTVKWASVATTCSNANRVLRAPFRLLRYSLRDPGLDRGGGRPS